MLLSYEVSITANSVLVKNGMRPKMSILDNRYRNFTDEELAAIEHLELNNYTNIEELVHFPNLKSLVIKSSNYNDIIPDVDYRECTVINHIENYEQLSNFSNLEELVIENDLYIEKLDLTNLNKLRKLHLINNAKLTTIVGLEDIETLDDVLMYGNPFSCKFNINKYAQNTSLAYRNILDINLYIDAIYGDRNIAKTLMNMEIAGLSKILFAEKSGFLNYSTINCQWLYDMFMKLDVFFRRNNMYSMSDYEKCMFVFNYLVKNVAFSEEHILSRNAEYIEAKNRFKDIPEQLVDRLNFIHSSYRAYHFKFANCEGIVNLGVFMLKMLGLDAYNVHCKDKRANSTQTNHSIIRVNFKDIPLYMDPTYDRKNSDKYCLINFEEISEYHDLDSFEYSLYKEFTDKSGGKKYVNSNINKW